MMALLVVGLSVGAAVLYGPAFVEEGDDQLLTHVAKTGDLAVTVTETGDLESASNVDLKCLVKGGSTILSIVKDGSQAKEGDVLVRLDASTIEEEISKQRIAHEKARAAHIQAQSDVAVAELAVTEYIDGTFRAELQTAQSNVAIAEENLRTATNRLEYTVRMFRKGYVSDVERDAQEFAVEHARLELALKRTEEDVLERFTKAKTLQELRSALKAAQAKLASEAAALELEESRLKRLESQKENCVIEAPQDGMVIYPEVYRWSQEPEVKEGATVREQQTLIQLPDLSNMQVKVQVHESKVEQIKPGMKAVIKVQDREWPGEVVSISNRAEQSGWWSGNSKEFATIVRINGDLGLKPGMSGEVEIEIARHEDVVTVPVAAVVEQHGRFYCWVATSEGPQIRPVIVGPTNDQFIVVEHGVRSGEEVVLNPRSVIEDAQRRALQPPMEAEDSSQESPEETAKGESSIRSGQTEA